MNARNNDTAKLALDSTEAAAICAAIVQLAAGASELRAPNMAAVGMLEGSANKFASRAWDNMAEHGEWYRLADCLGRFGRELYDFGLNETGIAALERMLDVVEFGPARDLLESAAKSARLFLPVQTAARELRRAESVVDGSDMALARSAVARPVW